ncbi:ABC transporter thiamine pyrophosphate-binding lipoprotein p37/Cypl [Mycoplasmopsis synoviae]|uniref:ABC transporter thiamine pyrophosphate-binding lipoprotein p37/Cypl n=1 Tax=Mycoplasmopsis synoviae TaxID=2109 RepID=UPI00036B6A04|nr:hypothetical protein [Mycoplasmopsis synoviae]AKB10866.1 P37-like ABC transporter substrate-binding lipoprotein [Mycoplasmopsis synoviae ATCC 25204]
MEVFIFNFKKLKLLLLIILFSSFVASSCGFASQSEQKLQWDATLTLYGPNFGNLFSENLKSAWIKKVQDKFNELKNSNPETKNYPDVVFDLKFLDDKNLIFQNLNNNLENYDFGILNATTILKNKNSDLISHPLLQTKTLKFLWSLDDSKTYFDGSENDPLITAANEANKIQFENELYGPYSSWNDENKKILLKWDGSKYNVFYKDFHDSNNFSSVFRGSILISGTKEIRDEIIKAWNDKNWEKFLSFGIVIRNFESLSRYNAQVEILAKQFNKNVSEIKTELQNPNNKNVLIGRASNSLGVLSNQGKVFNIAFDYEGVFNWTPPYYGSGNLIYNFKPSDNNSSVRYLTFTNPIIYDQVFARRGLSEIQKELFAKALASLSFEDNTYGNYTGYNQFSLVGNNEK